MMKSSFTFLVGLLLLSSLTACRTCRFNLCGERECYYADYYQSPPVSNSKIP